MAVEKLITDHIDIWTSALQTRSTAGRGSNGKIDLYGIKKLRELILELAVRGKLVPQDPNDEPASELLKRIAAEKAELVKHGKIKKQKPLPEISEDEKPFELPEGWECARLGNTVAIIRGITFPASEKHKEPSKGKIACLRTANVQDSIEWDDLLYVSESFVKRSEQFAEKGDIVMSMANSRELVGKVAYIYNIPTGSATFGGFLSVIRPYGFNAAFLMSVLRSPNIKSILIDSSSQTTNIANISLEKLNPLVISVPPIGEQNRIASKVEELMSLCDQLEQQSLTSLDAHQQLVETLLATLTDSQNAEELTANWARISQYFDTLFTTEASIDALKQTILQLAVMGKLVSQDPNDESASNLLERISAEKKLLIKQKAIKKSQLMLPIDELDLPFDLPLGWQWIQLGDVCYVIADGPHFSPNYVDKNEGVAFLSARNISVESIDLTTAKYVSREDHENFCKRVRIRKGDILYTKGGTTGIAKVNDIDTEFSVWVHVAVLQIPLDKVFNEYLALTLNSLHCYEQSQKYTHGIGNKDLGLTRMINITIPLPPISEQYRIVTKANQLLALCDTLKSRLQSALQTRLQLADALTDAALN